MLIRRLTNFLAHNLYAPRYGALSKTAIDSVQKSVAYARSLSTYSSTLKRPNPNYKLLGAAAFTLTAAGLYLHKSDKNKDTKDFAFIGALLRYSKKHYGNLVLPEAIIQQLVLQQTSYTTAESNVRLANKEEDNLHIEIKRSLARWNCLCLLLEGDEKAYQEFVSQQPESEKLTYATFKKLSDFLAKQSIHAQQALEASCFIVMNDKIKERAKQKNIQFSPDSEKFLTDIITQCPRVYPIVPILSRGAQKLLPSLYLSNTHGRHMLYTEGGNNMFAVMKEKISHNDLTPEQYAVWLGRWIVNIAGFRGHENPQGSIYLTEKTAQAVLTLNDELIQLQSNPDYDVLTAYLQKRAQQLGVKSLYLAHIAASMRLYTPEEGKTLQNWFNSLSRTMQNQLEQSYQERCATLKTTPTYEVAVLDNLRALGCDISEALNIHSLITTKASQAYNEGIKQKKIDEQTPLSFLEIAFKNNLQPLVESYRATGTIPAIRVDDKGSVESEKQNSQKMQRSLITFHK